MGGGRLGLTPCREQLPEIMILFGEICRKGASMRSGIKLRELLEDLHRLAAARDASKGLVPARWKQRWQLQLNLCLIRGIARAVEGALRPLGRVASSPWETTGAMRRADQPRGDGG